MDIPEIQYARSGEVSIAYQVAGKGSPDLVFVRGFTGDLLTTWEQPLLVRHVEGLAENGRLLMLDKRGTGLSDSAPGVPSLEARMDDVRAVMDAAGSEEAVLWSGQEGTRVAILFAATYPERTSGLVILDPNVRGTRTPDYPWAPTEAEWRKTLRDVRQKWGRRDYLEALMAARAPTMVGDEDFTRWFITHMRRSLSPGAAAGFYRAMMEDDVSHVLGAVRVPTLILNSPAQGGPAEYVAQRIPHAEVHELSTMRGDFTWPDDVAHEETMEAVSEFVRGLGSREEPDRILTTVLFTDIVASTEKQAELGDQGWKRLVLAHHALVRDALARWRGVENDTAGDGFFAAFDGPARAIRCAVEIASRVKELGIEIRAGVHTGECEVIDNKCGGLTVSIGARVADEAGPSEVLVSRTVKDLVSGSGLVFEDAGLRELKGVPDDSWRLYKVVG